MDNDTETRKLDANSQWRSTAVETAGWYGSSQCRLHALRYTLPGLGAGRVETDWFAFDSEFRYILQPGDSIGAASGNPIGQVFFVRREPLTFRTGSDQEVASFQANFDRYQEEKRADQITIPSGFRYSPAYAKRMKGTW